MIRLRLPTRPRAATGACPPELRADAAPATVAVLLSRREFLRALAVVLAAVAAPIVRVERAAARARGRFFTKTERRALEALVDRIIPPDDGDPGAKELGAARYVEGLLTALDGKRTHLFAGGPFSGRNPLPDAKRGRASKRRPKNRFKRFVEPTRLQELYWRGELFGTASVPELAALDAQAGGPKRGLRDIYREGLARVDDIAQASKGGRFADLSSADQDAVLAILDDPATFMPEPRRGARFLDLVIRHTLEGCFSPPEYGGNVRGRGWALVGVEGDSQPLGYSIFSTTANGYVERPDHPMSTPNPDEMVGGLLVPKPLSPEGKRVQNTISGYINFFLGGANECGGGD